MKRAHHRRHGTGISLLLAGICAMLVATACDETFSPIKPTDLQFSIYGYLDASADTQLIRIMPIRPLVLTSPTPLDASVTLEHLGTGRIVELRDSVFRFSPADPEVGSEGVFVHNFWTAERIDPGATYRFSARWEGEESAEAVVETPSEYEVEAWIGQTLFASDRLRLAGVTHVPFVIRITSFYDQCGSVVDRQIASDFPQVDPKFISISRRFDGRGGACGQPVIEKQELLIVGSGSEWPSGPEYATFNLAVPEGPSNISNSLGFLGGVLTRLIPYEHCRIEGVEPVPDHCKLRYDEASASLSGVVRDATCGGPVARATVELRELDPEAAAHHKVRFTETRRSGEFEIGALEEGIRYALTVRRFIPSDPFQQYQEHTDTLEFSAGEQATYNVGLRRLLCGP